MNPARPATALALLGAALTLAPAARAQSADVQVGEPIALEPAPAPAASSAVPPAAPFPTAVVNPAIPPYPPLVLDRSGRPHIQRMIPYPGGPLPPGTHLHRNAYSAFLIAGAPALFLGYLLSVFTWVGTLSCTSTGGGPFVCNHPTGWLFVPGFGPWVALADNNAVPAPVESIVIAGAIQGIGITGIVAGLLWRRTFVVYEQSLMPVGAATRPAWAVVPWGAPGAAGLAAVGTF